MSQKIIYVLFAFLFWTMFGCSEEKSKEKVELNFGKEYIFVKRLGDVVENVLYGNADVGILDFCVANFYLKSDAYSSRLTTIKGLPSLITNYGVACRKGADGTIAKINEGLIKIYKDGTLKKIATKYGIDNQIFITDKMIFTPFERTTNKDDWDYIRKNRVIKIGCTFFAPIAYKYRGDIIGFDIDLAIEIMSNYGLKIDFIEIDWSLKEQLLASKK